MSLRTRLTAVFAALFGGLLIPFLFFLYLYLTSWFNTDLHELTEHDAAEVVAVFSEHDSLAVVLKDLHRTEADEFQVQIRLLDETGKVILESYGFDGVTSKSHAVSGPWGQGTLGGTPYLIYRTAVTYKSINYICEVWKSAEGLGLLKDRLRLIFGFGAPIILLFSALVGYLFARRALSPVDRLREQADMISSDDLSARLPLPRNRDELHRLTATLNRLLARIEGSFDAMKRFTADASHELRIPLTNLRGIIDVNLRKKRTLEEHEEDMGDALDEVHRLTHLTTNLLTLATIDSSKQSLSRTKTDVLTLLKEVIESARRLDLERKLSFVLNAPEMPSVNVNAELVRQVLFILVDNAIKYTPAGGRVTLSASQTADQLQIDVADTGEGIQLDEQERIFERFYRIDKSRARAAGGSGLGLAIARSIAKSHGGQLTVISEPGHGSTFRLVLPTPTD